MAAPGGGRRAGFTAAQRAQPYEKGSAFLRPSEKLDVAVSHDPKVSKSV